MSPNELNNPNTEKPRIPEFGIVAVVKELVVIGHHTLFVVFYKMSSENVLEYDCAVCLQKCNYPTQLPCGHIFCFLCVKGVAIQSKRCAMCRANIPPDYLDHPTLLTVLTEQQQTDSQTGEFQWYYEGRNGWWKYDERSNAELETAYNAGDAHCKLLLAGALYCVYFEKMLQMQSRNPSKRRRVRRDSPSLPAKGIAGIKIVETQEIKLDNEPSQGDTDEVIVLDEDDEDENNRSIGIVSPGHDIIGDVIQRIRGMSIHTFNVARSRRTEEDS